MEPILYTALVLAAIFGGVCLFVIRHLNERLNDALHDRKTFRALHQSCESETKRLNTLIRQRDVRIQNGKADNRSQSKVIEVQAQKLLSQQKLLNASRRDADRNRRLLERMQNVLDDGTCHDCFPEVKEDNGKS
jgi:hypothetical protein